MPMLRDPFGRNIEYLRLSVTDRCDFRCFYCLPKGFKDFTPPSTWLTLDEIERLIRVFSEMGVSKVRLTGGEPLVRKDLPELVQRLGALPQIEDLSLSTNASQLEKYADSLKQSGVSRINVSLDSLDRELFRHITQGDLDKVLAGLKAAKRAGMNPIKINMVVMKGVNDHEIGDMVDFCLKHDFTLRFIETMPVGETGKNATDRYVDLREVRKELERRFMLEPAAMRGAGPASYVRVADTDLRIGFITPMSQHFCETCNRVRLSIEGTLYLCLGKHDNAELRPLLRQGVSDEGLKEAIFEAISRKPERHEFNENPGEVMRVMSLTGG
ncbi:GTP 3',8-cyclase MoaA [endosymbiont of Ridgeia piscesae]|uniref:GTP 3',8-cyclase n=1 Tax=endosymbiont of Ridgeia piscesae TaxID=54398 RepID=A0A0T5YZ77_9GAMM|nr:GTP 3',8-cyclase MoaA [endosymbiont of Ridgeia piscesae]KRT55943.1 molybdenum cofactor biosynthesis protein A, bacterial [endosymbiont of Ridgeia piscesae]KRT57009.1 cyclic pyranopterin phosphate synthase [endosymbiont of Ridgeia piscesae]